MTLVAALGANLLVLAVAVPLLLARGWAEASPPGGAWGAAAIVALGPALLAAGVWRRSTGALLLAFPVAAMLPQAIYGMPDVEIAPPAPFPLLALSLLAFLVAASRWLAAESSRAEAEELAGAIDLSPVQTRSLAGAPIPARWRRRLRIYRLLAACALVLPAALLGYAHYSPTVRADLRASFAGRAEAAATFVTVGIGLLAAILFRGYLLAPLRAHLAHDRDLGAFMATARKQARRGRPRIAFYFAVAAALGFMLLLMWRWGGRP
jgi:hypothetical protein